MTDNAGRIRPPLTDEHFACFGQIVCGYASCEIVLKALLAVMTNTDHLVIHTLTHGMTGPSLLLKIRAMNALDRDTARRDQVEGFTKRLEALSAVRNEIAHGSWTASQRPGAVRPSGMSVKTKGARVIGFEDGEKDYSLEDLHQIVDATTKLHVDIVMFLKALGVSPSD